MSKKPRIVGETRRDTEVRPPPSRYWLHDWYLPRSSIEVYVAESVMRKIIKHCVDNVESRLEVMGFLLGDKYMWDGKVYTVVWEAVTTDLDATSVSVKFRDDAFEHLFAQMSKIQTEYLLVGWYHSHPGHTCFLSETDIRTQKTMFNKPYQSAMVVDPINKEMKVFKLDGDDYTEIMFGIAPDDLVISPSERLQKTAAAPARMADAGMVPASGTGLGRAEKAAAHLSARPALSSQRLFAQGTGREANHPVVPAPNAGAVQSIPGADQSLPSYADDDSDSVAAAVRAALRGDDVDITDDPDEVLDRLRAKPDDVQIQRTAVFSLCRAGREEEAMEVLRKIPPEAVAERRTWDEPLQRMMVEGEIDASLAAVTLLTRAFPEVPWPWELRLDYLRQLERYDDLIEAYDDAIRRGPARLKAGNMNSKGVLFHKLKRYDEAIQCYDESLALNPKNVKAIYNRGLALGAKGEMEEAVRWFSKAIAINPNYSKAWFDKGVAQVNMGLLEDAIRSFEAVLRINPGDKQAQRSLEICRRKLAKGA